MTIEARLQELGFQLPTPPTPVASYVPMVLTGNLVFVSGQGPLRDGQLAYQGKVGAELSEEEGYKAAQLCALNALAVLKQGLGDLEQVTRVVKLLGWVASAPGFNRQPWVINGASDLLGKVFEERGRHARSAVGTNELPLNIPVEVELVVEVR